MSQESLSLGSKVTTPARLGRHGSRLSWKFGTAFSGLILLLGAELWGSCITSLWERAAEAGRSTFSGHLNELERCRGGCSHVHHDR